MGTLPERMTWGRYVATAAVLLCAPGVIQAATAGGAQAQRADRQSATPNIVVTQEVEVDSPACRPHRVAVRVLRLLDALATVDRQALLGRFWGNDFASLALFGIPGRDFRSAPESPERTFRRLREWGGLEMRLTEILILVEPDEGAVNVTPRGSWLPSDGDPEVPIVSGKSKFRCDSPKVPVWNAISNPVSPGVPRCPQPPQPPPDGVETLIVCAQFD